MCLQGSGEWILQDDRFSYSSFASILKDSEVENALKQHTGSSLGISTFGIGDWNSNKIAKESYNKLLDVSLNNEDKLGELMGVIQFTAYLSYFVKVRPPKELLRSSDVVGSIRFSKPTMYIFPGCEGDSALFGISGFHLLVNAGYNRKACFWDFTRHLDRIDALLLTHLGADNILSVSTMMERKAAENVHPEIGFVYFNGSEKVKHSPNGDISPEDGGSRKPASLLVNLVEEGSRLVENMKQINIMPHPCHTVVQGNQIQPVNLYHKVGHGSLDLYVLNPQQDGKEMKDFLTQWNKHVDNFTNSKSVLKASGRDMPVPLPDMLSICALLVWRPQSPSENITRILFPGNCPQQRVFEGLDKLKNLDIFQQAGCSVQDLKSGNKKPAGKTASSKPTKSAPSSGIRKPPPTPAADKTSKTEKATKEIKNKKVVVDHSADKKKLKKSPSSASSSAKTTPTPEETATPVESPPSVTPSDTPADVRSPEPSNPPAFSAPQTEQPPEEPLVDMSLIAAEVEVVKTESEDVESKPAAPLIDNFLTEAAQNALEDAQVKAESAEMPEADQGFAVTQPPEPEPVVQNQAPAPELDSPEPLPDPTQFDPTSFIPAAEPKVEEKNDLFGVQDSAPAEPLVDFNTQNGVLEDPCNAEPIEQQDLVGLHTEAVNSAPEVEPEGGFSEEPQGGFDDRGFGSHEQTVESAMSADTGALDKQRFDDLGIYDDSDKDVDTAESEFTQQQEQQQQQEEQQQPMSQQLLEEMGIYDREEPESQQPTQQDQFSMDQLKDQGVCFGDEEYSDENAKTEPVEADSHTPSSQDEGVCAGESETESQEFGRVPTDVDEPCAVPAEQVVPDVDRAVVEERDVGGEPEVDQASYHSDVPQGLPSPQEPVLSAAETPQHLPEDVYTVQKCEERTEERYMDQKYLEEESQVQEGLMDQNGEEERKIEQLESEDLMAQEDEVQSPPDPLSSLYRKETPGVQLIPEEGDPMSSLYSKEMPGVQLIPETELDREDSYERDVNPDLMSDDAPVPVTKEQIQNDEPLENEPIRDDEGIVTGESQGQIVTDIDTERPTEDLSGLAEPEPEPSAAVSEPSSDLIAGLDEPTATMDSQPSPDGIVADAPGTTNPFDIMDAPQGFSHLQTEVEPSTNPFLGVSMPVSEAETAQPVEPLPASGDDFMMPQQQVNNPFGSHAAGADDSTALDDSLEEERDSLEKDRAASPNQPSQQQAFDPLSSWGEPMGLPAPPPPTNGAATTKKPAAKPSAARNGPAKGTPKKTEPLKKTTTASPTKESAPKRPSSATASKQTKPSPTDKKPAPASSTRKPAPAKTTAAPAKKPTAAKEPAKTRPATAPAKAPAPKTASTKRPASAAATASKTSAAKPAPTPQLGPVTPFYVDLTYVPAHGDPSYSDIDFFRRIRARYYVISALSPPPSVFNALLEAKQMWEDKDLEVTILPTYDNDTLRHWMALHRDELASLKINVAPSVSRCTIQLQDHETSCSAYRLEF